MGKGTLTITHTRTDGTLLEGSRKGDGVYEIVSSHGFRFSRSVGLYIRQSRDKAAMTWKINPAADALRAAGWEVEIEIDEDNRRSFAEAEADRVERAEARAERFAEYAGSAAGRAEARRDAASSIAKRFEFGQPILLGHHSQRKAERDAERIDQNMRKSFAEASRAEHWAGRAQAAEHYHAHRNNPARTLRRINKLEADIRRVRRNLDGTGTQGWNPNNPDHVAELSRCLAEYEDELSFWRDVIARAEAEGFKVWGKPDFKKGDFARIRGRWYEVLRVNAKTLTVPGGPDIRPVITAANRVYSWNDTMPYDGVTGRNSAEEMRELLADN